MVEWRGLPVWILHRTPEMLQSVKKADPEVADPKSLRTQYPTPEYARNEFRSIKPEFLITVGVCTHLGCSPSGPYAGGSNAQLGADPGFVCPCHGSTFDLAGRVFKNKPAPDNLPVPPHKYLSATRRGHRRRLQGLIGQLSGEQEWQNRRANTRACSAGSTSACRP